MEIEGNIMRVGPIEEGTSKAGNQWRRQTVVVEFFEHDTDMWSQKIVVQLTGHYIDFGLKQGDKVKMRFGLYIDEWNGKFYQTVKLAQDGLHIMSRMNAESTESTDAKGNSETTGNQESKEVKGDKDDLPF